MPRNDRNLRIATVGTAVLLLALLASAYLIGATTESGASECVPGEDVRWINVCMSRPDEDAFDYELDGELILVRPAIGSDIDVDFSRYWKPELIIDAVSGEVLDDSLATADPTATQHLVRSIRKIKTQADAWPFIDAEPTEFLDHDGVRYAVPDPATGVKIGFRGLALGCRFEDSPRRIPTEPRSSMGPALRTLQSPTASTK